MGTRPLVCSECDEKYNAFNGKCLRCGSDFVMKNGLPHCNTCESARHPFDGVVSLYFYTDKVRDAIIAHKFDITKNSSVILCEMLANRLKGLFTEEKPDCITFVPSHRQRIFERGYDHISEYAEQLEEQTGIPVLSNALVKIKHNDQQSLCGSLAARMRNVRGCYKISDKESVKGRSFILLDDVYTTGATARECAKVLKRAGASYILIVTLSASEVFKR